VAEYLSAQLANGIADVAEFWDNIFPIETGYVVVSTIIEF